MQATCPSSCGLTSCSCSCSLITSCQASCGCRTFPGLNRYVPACKRLHLAGPCTQLLTGDRSGAGISEHASRSDSALLQVSAVSHKLARAAHLLPSLALGFWPCFEPCYGVNFGSSLALQLASHMKFIDISADVLANPSMPEFLASGSQMIIVAVDILSLPEAAQADHLLCYCSAVSTLLLNGRFMPAMLPLTTETLHATLSDTALSQPDAFLHHAANLPSLKELRIGSDTSPTEPMPFLLTCPVQLGQLQSLHIGPVSLSASEVKLSWVLRQPVSYLSLDIVVNSEHCRLGQACCSC